MAEDTFKFWSLTADGRVIPAQVVYDSSARVGLACFAPGISATFNIDEDV